ncbi:FAD binding domain-containing protein [Desulfomonile tiedjei]|uniref:Aerobic-type carbon monoxide dehydrogenase, middle subunit CoxM/CutM-like protein n=1 Tax=Desulfomonile tiedjei (strain ATCC 49306 / DSM 6799 / DCB-1) TaxID=706587 RepID=I4C0Q9_DESTA|nr:FAD binding domain-containing protein [Desulfomonile tiedjei]AFM23150.1 aerobic-type carbon monoxide dehydrogenase, middle subunit CoxM/CutM-like protein [Desulfomonile tiedjei DSM 6799]
MRSSFRYIRPNSLNEALSCLAEQGERAAVIAGGTDLSITIRKGELNKDCVVDISRLPEAKAVELADGALLLGAALTFTELIRNPLIAKHAPVLGAACRCIGSVQIRNAGTLGGNVANASPAADSVPALMVHNARVLVQSLASQRVLTLAQVVTGPYTTTLEPGEIILGFLVDLMPSTYRFSFQRIARRKALSIARANAAVLSCQSSEGKVIDFRLSVGSITPRPCRLSEAEAHLVGQIPSIRLIKEAAELVTREMIRKSGVRSSTEYKKPAVEGLVLKTITDVFRPYL